MVDAFGARLIALVHGVDPQIARLALRIGPPPFADAHPRGLGLVIPQTAFAIALLAAQIVQVGHRDARQPLILRLAVLLVFALQNAPCGRSAERVVGLVDGGQQFDVGPRVALRKAVPPIAHRFHRALGLIAGNQARHLRPAAPGHLLQVTPQQTARPAALLHVLLLAQHRLHPGIDLRPVFAKKVDFFAGVEKRRDPFQTQLLCFVHADHPSSACLHSSGSSCIGRDSFLHRDSTPRYNRPSEQTIMAMNKVVATADEAIRDIKDGDTLMLGGFGLCGIPENLIRALVKKGVKNLHTISNNVGIDDAGLGPMLAAGQIKSHKGSYVGENRLLEEMVLTGRIDLELIPQGTLAERIRAGGAGIPAFYTPTGFGTVVAEGKETREFHGRPYVLERALTADFALIKAWKGDRWGNLVYRKTAQNFNPMMATAGRITIAEVEHLVEPGEIDPDQVHTPSVYVHRIFQGTDYVKRIERRTVRKA